MSRILIVDDQPPDRALLHAFLQEPGTVLLDAASGERAVELLRAQPFDLVLLDAMLPGMDGFETAARLKTLAAGDLLPVVMVTALGDTESRVRGLRAGVDDFVSKPIDRTELVLRVKNLLALRAERLELVARNAELQRVNQFRDDLMSLLVHDLKNPLTVVLGNLELLADETAGTAEAAAMVADARSAARRMLGMVVGLLNVARAESMGFALRRTTVRIGALLEAVAAPRAVQAAARGIRMAVRGDPEVTVNVDPDLVERVLENLVDNALRYAPAGGTVELAAHPRSGAVAVSVANDGPPVPPDARQLIFEKFAQLPSDGARRNVGLGLYFCRLVAQAHGGRIWVEDTPRFPTVFVLELPR